MSVERVMSPLDPGWHSRTATDLPAIPRVESAPPPAAPREVAPAPGADIVGLRAAVAEINRALADSRRELAFSVDEDTGRTVVRVIDAQSGDVLRQFPSEEVLVLASRLQGGDTLASLGVEGWG
jgi:flagellar protein FlaG